MNYFMGMTLTKQLFVNNIETFLQYLVRHEQVDTWNFLIEDVVSRSDDFKRIEVLLKSNILFSTDYKFNRVICSL